jgi:hypothetical protein
VSPLEARLDTGVCGTEKKKKKKRKKEKGKEEGEREREFSCSSYTSCPTQLEA